MEQYVMSAVKGCNPNMGLPPQTEYDWYGRQIGLSVQYKEGKVKGTSVTDPERKSWALNKIRDTFERKSKFTPTEIDEHLKQFEARLENPGFLENVYYFRPWDSDFELMFYLYLWEKGSTARAMLYIHNYGWDLRGNFREIPEDDVWYTMSVFEKMNIDARSKAEKIVNLMSKLNVKTAVSLGCGEVPERFYGLNGLLKNQLTSLALFDTGEISPLQEIFPDPNIREKTQFFKESLFMAFKHFREQDFLWVTGIWPYLTEEQQMELILNGAKIVKLNGTMVFDTIIKNESLLRVVLAQGWPVDPTRPMLTPATVEEAVLQVRNIVMRANEILKKYGYFMDLISTKTIFAGPTPTSVQIRLEKRIA